jgi:hypothetical protein
MERGLYLCGDWVTRTASWSTKKAAVIGRQAAKAVTRDFDLQGCDTEVIAVADDSSQLQAFRRLAVGVRNAVPSDVLPMAPWMSTQS